MTGKSNKQSKSGKTTQQEVAAAPVAQEPATAPVAVQEPVAVQPVAVTGKKGGKGKAQAQAAPAPAPVQQAAPAQQEGGKRKRKAAATEEVAPAAPAQEGEAVQAPKKRRARAAAAPAVEAEQPAEGEAEVEQGGRHLRSFKVRLPNKEEYEGRFTGLTPYQAANKALSKYFRETENPQAEVTFSICESTRKSKKSVYTYVGRRVQLENPVRYTIDGGREIVKNFKNSLKKVKKQQAEPVQQVAAPEA